jgi:hypothetical protein
MYLPLAAIVTSGKPHTFPGINKIGLGVGIILTKGVPDVGGGKNATCHKDILKKASEFSTNVIS